jgi:hypothetical protein
VTPSRPTPPCQARAINSLSAPNERNSTSKPPTKRNSGFSWSSSWAGPKDERCFARQEGGESSHTLPGLRCFVVDKLHKVELGDPIPVPRQALSAEEQQRTDCVTVVDEPCT